MYACMVHFSPHSPGVDPIVPLRPCICEYGAATTENYSLPAGLQKRQEGWCSTGLFDCTAHPAWNPAEDWREFCRAGQRLAGLDDGCRLVNECEDECNRVHEYQWNGGGASPRERCHEECHQMYTKTHKEHLESPYIHTSCEGHRRVLQCPMRNKYFAYPWNRGAFSDRI